MSALRLTKCMKTYNIYDIYYLNCRSILSTSIKPNIRLSSQATLTFGPLWSLLYNPRFERKILKNNISLCSTSANPNEGNITENENTSKESSTEIIKDNRNIYSEDDTKRVIMKKGMDQPKTVPYFISAQYLMSEAYKETYGTHPVWHFYRRNHKGQRPPAKTRQSCFHAHKMATGNPCPICRDELLVLHHKNVKLLEQFICPYTGKILSYTKTGICQMRYYELLVAVRIAKDCGQIVYDVPFRTYDYADYYPSVQNK